MKRQRDWAVSVFGLALAIASATSGAAAETAMRFDSIGSKQDAPISLLAQIREASAGAELPAVGVLKDTPEPIGLTPPKAVKVLRVGYDANGNRCENGTLGDGTPCTEPSDYYRRNGTGPGSDYYRRNGTGPGSDYYERNGTGPGSDHYRRNGTGPGSDYYERNGTGPGSDYYRRNGTGPGSDYYRRNGTGPGSDYYRRNGTGPGSDYYDRNGTGNGTKKK